MVRWSWIEWAIAGAAAAASLLCAPAVCGDPIAPPVATPLGPVAPTASVDVKIVASVRPPIGKLLLDVETGEVSVRRASIEELSRSTDARCIGMLIAAMKDDDADVRRAAMLGLWRVGRPAYDRLILALSDDD